MIDIPIILILGILVTVIFAILLAMFLIRSAVIRKLNRQIATGDNKTFPLLQPPQHLKGYNATPLPQKFTH